jgi:hypothetical protein
MATEMYAETLDNFQSTKSWWQGTDRSVSKFLR